MEKGNEKKVYVEREVYKKDGKDYFAYIVKSTIRGKDVKASVKPADIGGYDVLDLVFGDSDTAELVLVPFAIKDTDGKEITGVNYEAQNKDEVTGLIYKMKVKPSKPSDKSLLDMIIALNK